MEKPGSRTLQFKLVITLSLNILSATAFHFHKTGLYRVLQLNFLPKIEIMCKVQQMNAYSETFLHNFLYRRNYVWNCHWAGGKIGCYAPSSGGLHRRWMDIYRQSPLYAEFNFFRSVSTNRKKTDFLMRDGFKVQQFWLMRKWYFNVKYFVVVNKREEVGKLCEHSSQCWGGMLIKKVMASDLFSILL